MDELIGYTDHHATGVLTLFQIRCMDGGIPAYGERLRTGGTSYTIPVYVRAGAVTRPSPGA